MTANTLCDAIVGRVEFAPDGAGVYSESHDAAGRASFWDQPLTGAPRRCSLGSTPSRARRIAPTSRPAWGRFFFTINDRQSDVSAAELITC